MIELRKMEAWDAYLPGLFFSRLGLRIDGYDIEPVDTGKMNFVFRVRTDKGTFFLKQALSETRAGTALGPALRAISTRRLEYEKNCIAEIGAVLPAGAEVPTVHHYDAQNRILVLSDVAGRGGKLLETALLERVVDVSAASAVGRFLGVLHRRTWGTRGSIRGSRRKDRENWERFLKMRTKGVSGDAIRPEISERLGSLYADTLQRHTHDVLIWMDCCPKNVLVGKNGRIGLVDFELASRIGDPAHDLGFFIGHYLIHAILENRPAALLRAAAGAIRAYGREAGHTAFSGEMTARVLKFAAATVFYRVAGASRLDYIDPEAVPILLHKAGAILCHDFKGGPDEAAALIADTLTRGMS